MQFQTGFCPLGPLDEPVDPLGDVPEQVGAVLALEARDRIDVERDDVAAFHILGIVLEVRPRPAAVPLVVGHPLPQVQQDGPCRVLGLELLVVVHDLRRRDRRAVAAAAGGRGRRSPARCRARRRASRRRSSGRPCVPGPPGSAPQITFMPAAFSVLELLVGGTPPEGDVEVDAGLLVPAGLARDPGARRRSGRSSDRSGGP